MIQIQKFSADLKNIQMEVEYIDFPQHLGSEQQNYKVKTDKKRLQQVLLNL
jgi:signal transduction histidine kinase